MVRRFRVRRGGTWHAARPQTTDWPVSWIFVVLVLALTLAVSRFRPAGIIGGVILAIMLIYGLMQRMSGGAAAGAPEGPQRGKPASAPVAVAFPLESLATDGLQLSG